MLQIRKLELHEVKHVLAIQAECYPPFYHESEESFRAKIAATAQTCWLSLLNGKPVGYLIALPVSQHTFPSLSAPRFTLAQSPALLYLHDLAVLPAARSLRLGRRFIDAAIAAAKECALPAIGLIAVQDAAAYWQKAGFSARREAPVIFMVHGGGWAHGDKTMRAVIENKVAHWVPRGYVFISTNYRLLPYADPQEQVRDVARALTHAQDNAASWGGDRNKFVLIGHSAGAW